MPRPRPKRARRGVGELGAEAALTKREARLAKKIEQRRAEARRARMRRIRNLILVGAMALAIGLGVWVGFIRSEPELAGVDRPPNRGRGHVANATYDSAVPTSGPHDARAPDCGTFPEELPPALAVHALEHGIVVLWYDADQPHLADDLLAATSEFDSHVIIAANEALDTDVVATAWNRRAAYGASDPKITEFVRTYRQRGPERVSCDF